MTSPLATPRVDGTVARGFEPVRDAFVENFSPRDDDPGDLGAALAIRRDGELVADLWGGWCDVELTRPWQADTLVNAYSVGKGVTAAAVLAAIDRGHLDLDAPVADTWAEFGAAGKGAVTLRQLLSHQGGLPSVRADLPRSATFDWAAMTAALADCEPWWEPGTAHGYHTNTFGFLVAEPVRRVHGVRFGAVVHDLLAGPLGADFFIGLPESEHDRVATIDAPMLTPTPEMMGFDGGTELDDMRYRAYMNPPGLSGQGTVNTRAWREAEVPSTNSHASARGVASIYAVLAAGGAIDGVHIVSRDLLAEATSVQSDGHDMVLDRESRFGLGFMLPQATRPIGVSDASFGHYGYGGSLGFADPDTRMGFGYVINRPGDRWQVPRTKRIIAALRECL